MNKRLFIILILLAFAVIFGCTKSVIEQDANIQYVVTCEDYPNILSQIQYNLPDGNFELFQINLPYTSNTYVFAKSKTCILQAHKLASDGTLTVSIFKNGVLWKTATSSMVGVQVQGTI